MASWDNATVKAQLRLTAQRLGQLQDKLESQAQITRRDIATLLQQGNVPLARAKARKLIGEDAYGDLLQTLEMQVGVILGHVNEFERADALNPPVVEAAASIVYAARRTNSRDLHTTRDLLVQRLGPEFVRSIAVNQDRYVPQRVLRATSPPPPTAARLDYYLYNVAKNHGVQWLPDFSAEQKVNAVSEMLDPSSISEIDLDQLRKLCSHGLPEHPPWLRPRVWRLLLGTLPPEKAKWTEEARKSRDSYYDLVRRLLEPFSDLPTPTSSLAPLDASLLDVSNKLAQVPSSLLGGLEEDPEASALCPLESTASEDIKIKCADNLTARLKAIREAQSAEAAGDDMTPEIRLEETPEIRLEDAEKDDSDEEGQTVEVSVSGGTEPLSATGPATPMSLSVPGSPSSGNSALSGPSAAAKTLLAPRAYSDMGTNQKHSSALLRLLYIHSSLNPANRFPHIASLLVPVYSALSEEVDLQDSPHVEADTFWVFEAMVGEFTDLENEENASVWTRKLSERLWWADAELAENLQTKGLDPALPHYSYRWLITLLTHTLPLLGVVMAWDALVSRPMSTRDSNPKLDYLMDICTSMLLCARNELLRFGKRGGPADLWSDFSSGIQSATLDEKELELAFVDGMTFLQTYPLDKVGGIETVLQAAFDLTVRRNFEANAAKAANTGFERLRESMWKGLGYPASALETHAEESDTVTESDYETHDEDETKTASTVATTASTLTSRLANTVWRGISNQSAMDAPPSPEPPSTPMISPSPSPSPAPEAPPKEAAPAASTMPNIGRSLFGYAEKLRESDAAANLAKVTTNWRVKALDAWTKKASTSQLSTPPTPPPKSRSGSASVDLSSPKRGSQWDGDRRRGSMPADDRYTDYVPPERPAFFRPPRDSIIIPPGQMLSPISPNPGEISPLSDTGSVGSVSGKRSGPRPLLLSSSSLITSPHPRSPIPGSHSRSPTGGSISSAADSQWADMVRNRRRTPGHKDSMSSLSSLSPADAFTRSQRTGTGSDRDSGFGSRIVPLRSSPSPVAPNPRKTTLASAPSSPVMQHRRTCTTTTSPAGSDSGPGSQKGDSPGSPGTVPSPPPPNTPHGIGMAETVRVKATEAQRGSVVLDDSGMDSSMSPVTQMKLSRRAPFPRSRAEYDDGQHSDSSATEPPSRTARAKPKRYTPKLAALRSRATVDTAIDEFGQKSLAPEPQDDMENAITPRAATFDEASGRTSVSPRPSRRIRKTSGDGNGEARTRKLSSEGRPRKLSGESTGRTRKISSGSDSRRQRNSAAVEGDDEGYNDLLSAYESEDV